NYTTHDDLRFFQIGRVWKKKSDGTIQEEQRVAGVLFNKKNPMTFYDAQQELAQLFDVLGVTVTWHKVTDNLESWYLAHQTALLKVHDVPLGYLGVLNPLLGAYIIEGYACLFEFN